LALLFDHESHSVKIADRKPKVKSQMIAKYSGVLQTKGRIQWLPHKKESLSTKLETILSPSPLMSPSSITQVFPFSPNTMLTTCSTFLFFLYIHFQTLLFSLSWLRTRSLKKLYI